MKNAIFWNVTPRGSCKNRCFGGTYRLHHQGEKNLRTRKNVSSIKSLKHAARKYILIQVLVTANVVPSLPIRVTLMMDAMRYFETSVLTRATRRQVPEDGILKVYG
jgi:hypothetical protein